MKTDTIFYRLFQSFSEFFFELINQSSEQANAYQFSSVEVKQLAFRIDGVFLPKTEAQPIYFLEVQFQKDHNFYGRFFGEIFLYLSQTSLESDWRGVIIYPNYQVESSKIERYQELLNPRRVQRIYLNQLENRPPISIGLAIVELIIVQETQVFEIATPLIAEIRQQIIDEKQQQDLLELLETILIYKLPRANYKEIEAMFSLSDLKQTKVYQEALEEGIKEGIKEGEILTKLASIPRMLKLGLSIEIIAASLDLPLETVQQEVNKNQ
ncbi:conserved hypothetical protein [Rippkaea orientalis PCC 8801]|uniref:Rpn family recombination-promoting nuclease/putative transposase n=1 Tax=Rippkaea orientalis (strain PCC 8801 / RF-1) TaxID=41431 RepID=B7K0D7_RIPO1|nr:Rpn family recombination-promoting nuclease/putative transposase [Rippkaea orientalis]ACK67421.1 conserved hypothetical protein [Rippkaea orientalis PCC 8801]